jgi:hypothetical protein
MNKAFSSYRKDKKLLKLWLPTYAQAFPNFVLLPFTTPFLAKTPSRTISGTVSMGRLEEGTITTMEVDFIILEVAIESIQVSFDTIEATIKIVHPSTLSTIMEIDEGTENLQLRDDIGVAPMVK